MAYLLPKVKHEKFAKPAHVPSAKRQVLTKIVSAKSSNPASAVTKSIKMTVSAGKSAMALLKKLKKGKGIL